MLAPDVKTITAAVRNVFLQAMSNMNKRTYGTRLVQL